MAWCPAASARVTAGNPLLQRAAADDTLDTRVPQYAALRWVVAERGRPPQHVTELQPCASDVWPAPNRPHGTCGGGCSGGASTACRPRCRAAGRAGAIPGRTSHLWWASASYGRDCLNLSRRDCRPCAACGAHPFQTPLGQCVDAYSWSSAGPLEDCTAGRETEALLMLAPGAFIPASDYEKLATAVQVRNRPAWSWLYFRPVETPCLLTCHPDRAQRRFICHMP